jgi:hypothetical protein
VVFGDDSAGGEGGLGAVPVAVDYAVDALVELGVDDERAVAGKGESD